MSYFVSVLKQMLEPELSEHDVIYFEKKVTNTNSIA